MTTGPTDTRNVVLVGHAGSGKTTLAESLLVAAGALPRAGTIAAGTTASDREALEHRQRRSINLAVLPLIHGGVRVNLIDTPGYPDFVGELRAGLRAADAALFVVSATDGVDGIDGATRAIWDECAAVGMPRAIVVTRLDHPRADFDATVAACQDAFGSGVLPLHLPLHDDPHDGTSTNGSQPLMWPASRPPSGNHDHAAHEAGSGVCGLIDLLAGTVADYRSGSRTQAGPGQALLGLDQLDPEHLDAVTDARNALIEGIIAESEDESLLDRYLAGEVLDVKTLTDDLETAVARGSFYPVVGAAGTALGTAELLDLFAGAFPSARERPLPVITGLDGSPRLPMTCDPAGPLVAEVVKTVTDPYVGRISLVRVFSGTLRPDTAVHVSGHCHADGARAHSHPGSHPDHDADERVGALSRPMGDAIDSCAAGDICAVTKLASAESGDTLSDCADPLVVQSWTMPEPLLPVAVEARARADEDKLTISLARLVAEDPTLDLEQNAESGQLVLWCMGEAHVDVVIERLNSRYGVAVDQVELRIPLRETLATAAPGTGRHVKQSGGHGQFAICRLEVEPLPTGAGFEFVDEVVGGSVPRAFIPSVEKGVRAQMARGVRTGHPVVDLRVRLVDGKAHSVDSSDMAFQLAGALALRSAAEAGGVTMLEPVLAVAVVTPDEHVGAVMGDLSGRRGRVVGTQPHPGLDGRTIVRAEVPEREMARYGIELRSITQGTGTFSRSALRHEPMPDHLVPQP